MENIEKITGKKNSADAVFEDYINKKGGLSALLKEYSPSSLKSYSKKEAQER